MENKELFDILKDHVLKIVANSHSEMTDEQFDEWINELTPQYVAAINQHIYKEVMELIGEDEETFDDLGVGKNELRDELRAAARRRFLDE